MKKLFGTFVAVAAILIAFTSCKKEGTDVIKLKVSQIEISVMGHQKIEVEKASGTIVWASKDINIASVVENGDVFGVAEGKTIVTATVGKASANVEVTVKAGGVTPPAGISVTDNSLADWEALPEEFVFSAECSDEAAMFGINGVAVYADPIYLNILVEFNPDEVVDLEWVPFHCYINTDNSDATGGYGDEFTDPNTDILLEGGIYSGGEPIAYNPAVFKWWGEVGADGWNWTDPSVEPSAENGWGAIVAEGSLPVGNSELVDGKFEIQLVRELIPATWSDTEFGIGFDVQQNWSSVGILPNAPVTDENPAGKAHKIQVKINK
jgi:hypothetical protein